VSDELGRVLDKYSMVILQSKPGPKTQNDSSSINGNSLLDLAMPQISPLTSKNNNCSNLEVLGDIFSSVKDITQGESSNVNTIPILKPVSLMSSLGRFHDLNLMIIIN